MKLDRHAPFEMHPFEHSFKDSLVRGKAKAAIAHRTLEQQHDTACTVVQIVEDLSVSGPAVGDLDPLYHLPRRTRRPARHDRTIRRTPIERRDDQPVICL